MIRCLAALLLLASCSIVLKAQTFSREYDSGWAATFWHFQFNEDGTWIRTSNGHFGNTTYTGTYEVKDDTVRILTGNDGTAQTVCTKYVMLGDSILLDTCNQTYYRKPGTANCIPELRPRYVTVVIKDMTRGTSDTLMRLVLAPIFLRQVMLYGVAFGWPENYSYCMGSQRNQSGASLNNAKWINRDSHGRLTKVVYDDDTTGGRQPSALLFQYVESENALRAPVHKIKDTGTGEVFQYIYKVDGQLDKIALFDQKGRLVKSLTLLQVEEH